MDSILKALVVVFALFAFGVQWYALSRAEYEKVGELIEKAEVNADMCHPVASICISD